MDTIQSIIKAIILATDKKIDNAHFDRTVQGRIMEVLPKNKCRVLVDGKEFKAKMKSNHLVNDVVDICVPQNNINKMFIVPNSNTSSGGNLEGDTKDCIITFTEPNNDTDVISGDTHSTIVGKFVKSIKTIKSLIGNLTSLETENKDNLISSINEVKNKADSAFQSASNGKDIIKGAITGKDNGIIIPENATFQQLADYITQIETGIDTSDATATAEYILAGLTAYVDNLKVTGVMPSKGETIFTPNDLIQLGEAGYYSKIKVNPRPVLSGDAAVGDVLANKTFYNNDYIKNTGTMVDRGTVNHNLPINGNYTIPAGKHSGSGKVTQDIPTQGAQTITPGTTDKTIASGQYLSGVQTIKGDANLVASKLPSDLLLFGVQGTRSLSKFASGSATVLNTSATPHSFTYSGGQNVTYANYIVIPKSALNFVLDAIIVKNASANATVSIYKISGLVSNSGGYTTHCLVVIGLAIPNVPNNATIYSYSGGLSDGTNYYIPVGGMTSPIWEAYGK